MTTVTVAVATYNRADLLDGLFETVFNQTYDNLELVIVNDGSTDDTCRILNQYADDDQVHVFHHEENQGVGAAKDRAAAEAHGEYVAFLDDDDRWHPTKLEKQVDLFQSLSDEYAVVQTAMENVQNGETRKVSDVMWTGTIWPRVLVKCMISFSTTMIRRDVLEELGRFDPSFDRVVDWDLWIRVAKDYKFAGIDEVLTTRYLQPNRITDDSIHGVEGRRLLWEKYQDEFEQHPEHADQFNSIWECKKGFHQLRQGDRRAAVRHFWNFLQLDGLSLRNLAWFTLAITGRPGYNFAKSINTVITE